MTISGFTPYLSNAALASSPITDWCSSTWLSTLPSTYRYPSREDAASTASLMAHPRDPVVPGNSARIFFPTWVVSEGDGVTFAP